MEKIVIEGINNFCKGVNWSCLNTKDKSIRIQQEKWLKTEIIKNINENTVKFEMNDSFCALTIKVDKDGGAISLQKNFFEEDNIIHAIGGYFDEKDNFVSENQVVPLNLEDLIIDNPISKKKDNRTKKTVKTQEYRHAKIEL